jgi:endonuclease/exonuclease/phosphatase (EEP) superfamily protein YafD
MDLTTLPHIALLIAACGLAAATVAGFLGAASGWLDYAAHFRPHLAVAALLAAAAGLLLDWQRGMLLVSALAIVGIVNIAVIVVESRYRVSAGITQEGPFLKIASVNVNFLNRQHALVGRWVRQERPDVLVVTEVDHTWVDAIEGLGDLYPHRAIGRTRFVTMLARRPWTSFEVVQGPRAKQGILVARFDVGGTMLTVIGAHPASPIKPHWVPARDAELDVIARIAREAPGPVAAMGDFNASPWSAPMRRLVRTSPLRYADLQATTWPTSMPRWLGIKIDHIMLGNGCVVADYQAGPNVGSDHRPVVATIRCTAAVAVGAIPMSRPTGEDGRLNAGIGTGG